MKKIGFVLVFVAMASTAFGGVIGTPEIDSNFAASAIGLAAGGLLVLRGRKR